MRFVLRTVALRMLAIEPVVLRSRPSSWCGCRGYVLSSLIPSPTILVLVEPSTRQKTTQDNKRDPRPQNPRTSKPQNPEHLIVRIPRPQGPRPIWRSPIPKSWWFRDFRYGILSRIVGISTTSAQLQRGPMGSSGEIRFVLFKP